MGRADEHHARDQRRRIEEEIPPQTLAHDGLGADGFERLLRRVSPEGVEGIGDLKSGDEPSHAMTHENHPVHRRIRVAGIARLPGQEQFLPQIGGGLEQSTPVG